MTSEKIAVECQECGKKFKTSKVIPECPRCGSSDIDVRDGSTRATRAKQDADIVAAILASQRRARVAEYGHDDSAEALARVDAQCADDAGPIDDETGQRMM